MKILSELFNLRAITLLRVSTKKQTSFGENGIKDDIPVQREIVNEFIEINQMKIIKEFVEAGVSASKIPLAKREALQEIFQMAIKKEFDVLVVFKYDRISRIQEEYPYILSFLNKHGVRIFTALDGTERKSPNAINGTAEDGLMNSVEGYTAAKESRNIKERVTSSHRVVIRQGKYRGGAVPFGYTTANLGETNSKGQFVQTIIINEEEANIVRKIYDLSLNQLMGIRQIAKWLNENGYKKYSRSMWSYQTIRGILHNETYKGYLHFTTKEDGRTFKSDKLENLIIIDEDTWDKTQKQLKKKIKKANTNVEIITNSKHSLLSGLVFCGYCGSRLSVWSNHKYYDTKKGRKKYIVYRYRCNLKSSGRQCNGNTTYGIKKIDALAETGAIEIMKKLSGTDIRDDFINAKKNELETIKKRTFNNEKELNKKEKQIIKLKDEIPNALIGDSVFSSKELKEALITCEQEYKTLLQEKEDLETYAIKLQENYSGVINLKVNTNEWLEKYPHADFNTKKILLNDVIKRVDVYKHNIKITAKKVYDISEIMGCKKV